MKKLFYLQFTLTPKTPYDIVNKVIKQERRSNPLLASLTRTFSGKKFKLRRVAYAILNVRDC